MESLLTNPNDPMPWETAGGTVKGVASGAKEKVKPISAQREEYGMKGAKNGYSTYLSALALIQLFVMLLAGQSKLGLNVSVLNIFLLTSAIPWRSSLLREIKT